MRPPDGASLQDAEALLRAEKVAHESICAELESVQAKLDEAVEFRWDAYRVRASFHEKIINIQGSDRHQYLKDRLIQKINQEIDHVSAIIKVREGNERRLSAEVARLEAARGDALQKIVAATEAVRLALDYPTMDEARAATQKAEELARAASPGDVESLRAAAEAARVAKRAWGRIVINDGLWNAEPVVCDEITAASQRCTELFNQTRAAWMRLKMEGA